MAEIKDMSQEIAAYQGAVSEYYKDPADPKNYEQPQEEPNEQPEQDDTAQATKQEPESNRESDKPRETSKEYNLRVLRERAEAAEKRQKELEQRYAQMEDQVKSWQSNYQQYEQPKAKQTYEEPEEELADDDIPTWGQQKRYLKKIEKMIAAQQEENKKKEQERAVLDAEKDFKREHPDAERVLSRENLDMLKRIYPYDYQGIEANPNFYGKMKAAYNMIQRYGIMEDSATEQRIQKNVRAPRPGSSGNAQVSNSPLGKVDEYGRRDLSEADKEAIRMQMMKARGLL